MNSLYKMSRKRILALYATSIMIIGVLSSVATIIVNDYYQEQFIVNENEKFLELFKHTMENDSESHALLYTEHYTHVNEAAITVKKDGETLFQSEKLLRNAREYEVVNELSTVVYTIRIDNTENSILLINNREADFITLIVIVSISLLLLYVVMSRRMKNKRVISDISKIERLMKKNEQLSGDLNYIELQEIYNSFYNKITTIDLMEEKRKDNLNGLVHDLKTPVTILLNHLEDVNNLEDLTRNKDAIRRSLEDLSSTASDILSENFMGTKRVFSLSQNLKSELSNYINVFQSKNITLKYSVAENVNVYWNKRDFDRVLRNLLTNAYYYSNPDTTVYVHLLSEKDKYLLKVINSGQVIKQEELKRIFEKSTRSDKDANKNGNGLGLYITKLLVEEVHGKIYADSNETENTFTIEFQK